MLEIGLVVFDPRQYDTGGFSYVGQGERSPSYPGQTRAQARWRLANDLKLLNKQSRRDQSGTARADEKTPGGKLKMMKAFPPGAIPILQPDGKVR
jgi:hypothetical protein